MQTTRFTLLSGLALAVVLTLLVGQMPVFGQDDREGADDCTLEGTWNVTLTFLATPGTGCVAMGPILTLNTFLPGGGMLFSGGRLTAGPGQGSWERIGHNHFVARFKFFVFNISDGSRTGSEELTKDIRLTCPDRGIDTFKATTTFDFVNVSGTPTSTGCIINDDATRFE